MPLSRMKKLLIVSHTPSPNTRAMTNAVVEGASHVEINGIEVLLNQPLETGPEEVLAADALWHSLHKLTPCVPRFLCVEFGEFYGVC